MADENFDNLVDNALKDAEHINDIAIEYSKLNNGNLDPETIIEYKLALNRAKSAYTVSLQNMLTYYDISITEEDFSSLMEVFNKIKIIANNEEPVDVTEFLEKHTEIVDNLYRLIDKNRAILEDLDESIINHIESAVEPNLNEGKLNVKKTVEIVEQLKEDETYSARIKKYINNLGITKFGTIKFLSAVTVIGMLIALIIMINKKQIDPVTAATIYANQLSGCYMITGSSNGTNTVVKLKGCSDWYGTSLENQVRCGCNSTTSTTHPTDCTVDCGMPYCIGQTACTGTTIPEATQCTDPLNPSLTLGKCVGNIGDSNFVFYTYQQVPPIALFLDTSKLNMINNKNNNNIGMKILKIGGITLLVILLVVGIIFLVKYLRLKGIIKI